MHSTGDLRYIHPMLYQPTDIACTEHRRPSRASFGGSWTRVNFESFLLESWFNLPAGKLSTNRHQSCTFSLLAASKHGLLSQNQGKSIVQKSEAEVERISSRSSQNLQTPLSFPTHSPDLSGRGVQSTDRKMGAEQLSSFWHV